MADLLLNVEAKDEASPKLKEIGKSAQGMGDSLKKSGDQGSQSFKALAASAAAVLGPMLLVKKAFDFVADGVKGLAEEEAATLQLTAAMKQMGYESEGLSEALAEQAQAFKRTLGVEDEMITKLQALSLRLGVAPRDLEKTTQAVLDYAAATGTDATSALEKLVRGAEGGGAALKKMGIHIQDSGDKTKNLNAAVDAMQAKFGGAAAAAADGMTGKMNRLSQQFEDTKKAVAALVLETGILEVTFGQAAKIMTFWTDLMRGGDEAAMKSVSTGEKQIKQLQEKERLEGEIRATKFAILQAEARGDQAQVDRLLEKITKLTHQLATIRLERERLLKGMFAGGPDLGGLSKEAKLTGGDDNDKKKDKPDVDKIPGLGDDLTDILDQQKRDQDAAMALAIRHQNELNALAEKAANERVRLEEEKNRKIQSENEKFFKQQQEELQAYADLGGNMAAAIINGFKDKDPAGAMKSILKVGIQGIVGLIGMSNPIAGAFLGPVAGAITSLFHDGGAVGGPRRYHSGGTILPDEVPAILQTGEHVLSRRDVASMGGHSGVEAAKRGTTNVTYHISAIDSRSFEENLRGRGGAAHVRSVRTGRGEYAAMMRKLEMGRGI